VSQYAPPLAAQFGNLATVPPEYLLWFHRLPWNHSLPSGRTVWEDLVAHYDHGVAEVAAMQNTWSGLSGFVDPERFKRVSALLEVQAREARWWRDACLAYFQDVSGLPFPDGVEAPENTLEYYRSLSFPVAPGN
jgi:alpha-glucuronidase